MFRGPRDINICRRQITIAINNGDLTKRTSLMGTSQRREEMKADAAEKDTSDHTTKEDFSD